jgi:hypothetical protein
MNWIGKTGFTLLLATPGWIARADFDGRSQLLASFQGPLPPGLGTDGAAWVGPALGLGKRVLGPVWVLSSAVLLSTQETSRARMQGLAPEERASALAFEGETFTGRSPGDFQTAAVLLKEDGDWQTYWLAQASTRWRQELEEELSRQGARLAGVAHPGGMGAPEAGDAVELWGELFLHLRRQPAGEFSLELVDFDGSDAAAESLLDAALGVNPGQPIELTAFRAGRFERPLFRAHSLEKPEEFQSWMARWGARLGKTQPGIPFLPPERRRFSRVSRFLLSSVGAAACLGICAGHWTLTRHQIRSVEARIRALEETGKRRGEFQSALERREKLRVELAAATARHRVRQESFPRLLEGLALHRPEGVQVRRIDESPNADSLRTTVHGVCVEPQLAGAFANALATDLVAAGWEVRPATQKAALYDSRVLWEFEIPLELKAVGTGGSRNPKSR